MPGIMFTGLNSPLFKENPSTLPQPLIAAQRREFIFISSPFQRKKKKTTGFFENYVLLSSKCPTTLGNSYFTCSFPTIFLRNCCGAM